MMIQIALRAPNGQSRIQVEDESTLSDLVALIKSKTELERFSLKYGYPLKNLDISLSSQSSSIKDLKLRGETIVVAPIDTAPAPAPEPAKPAKPAFVPKGIEPDETSLEWASRGGYIVLRVMPDDNSCMFTAVGGALSIDNPSSRLRAQITEYILTHPEKYTAAILGSPPQKYCSHLMEKDTWGGAIELSILSDIYDIEISSIDVKSLRVDRFGEGKETRIIILYSGIHYDRIAFALDLSYPVDCDVTKWDTQDKEVLTKARQLAAQLQRMHYYTDTTDFVIKCEVCQWIGKGMKEAGVHQKETGHKEFGEMTIQ
ncbi:ubiquitin-specific protease otu1 [Podospora bellae-mahoneyi]|uniref:Ubiquitin thioesterase OTU n=1 Tax=Podospora bellae-mahoneyi TaxID=2093777 RepID=A0ABR0FH12_9PEZI|nr:ubiquitin-specific protease otu1 [Podospora bellae-mahoneyi]